MAWTLDQLGDLTGRTAVVTGANSGIGFETAQALAGAGARVVLAVRDLDRGQAALRRINERHPTALATLELLDTADQASVAGFASHLASRDWPLDILVNNAGIAYVPQRRVTAEGFELQLATNYLGHFALTARLLPLLRRSPAPRVVSVASLEHRRGRIHFEDLQLAAGYGPERAYRQSKLAQLLFARELHRRSRQSWPELRAIPVHPGGVRTAIFDTGPRLGGSPPLRVRLIALAVRLLGQAPPQGAWPLLFAAGAPEAEGGQYYGPTGLFEMRGGVGPAEVAPQGRDANAAARLWDLSEALTGCSLDLSAR